MCIINGVSHCNNGDAESFTLVGLEAAIHYNKYHKEVRGAEGEGSTSR